MKRVTELIVFLSLALSIHVLMAMRVAHDGGDAEGAGGDAFVSITGAPASIETLLADWTAASTHKSHMMEMQQPDQDIKDALNTPAPDKKVTDNASAASARAATQKAAGAGQSNKVGVQCA
ncbi:hypothetical protein [uncultured Shimia sp.]|uniref:hypothetical protein n=1 Tax=uncultured Shimia sp. TaxID=573152 RepID=UPI0025F72356|nr:hypothetical protein [uncultured Shimia sp.]